MTRCLRLPVPQKHGDTFAKAKSWVKKISTSAVVIPDVFPGRSLVLLTSSFRGYLENQKLQTEKKKTKLQQKKSGYSSQNLRTNWLSFSGPYPPGHNARSNGDSSAVRVSDFTFGYF
jgi:hypothetical protein